MTSLIPSNVKVTETECKLPGNLSFEKWVEIGGSLQQIGKSYQWWLGDWLNYGEQKYGEKYAQAIEVTGRALSTLQNCAFVADNVPPEIRSPVLSWSHHREVASLKRRDQKKWLRKAEEGEWSKRELADAIEEATPRGVISADTPATAEEQLARSRREETKESETPKKNGRELPSAKRESDAALRKFFGPLVRSVDRIAVINGKGKNKKGANWKRADKALGELADALIAMGEGEN